LRQINPKGQADPDNQHQDKWCSCVFRIKLWKEVIIDKLTFRTTSRTRPTFTDHCFITHNRSNMKQYVCASPKPHSVYWWSAIRAGNTNVSFYSILNHTHTQAICASYSGDYFRVWNRSIIRPQYKNSGNSVLLFLLFPSCNFIVTSCFWKV